jgi:cation diffusion facilitator CzcD-associated flavoprotein CzcO
MGNTAKHVGVIGAGVSGVATAAYLKAAGLEVTIFERSSVAGGVWYVSRKSYSWLLNGSNFMPRVFDRRLPHEPPYPSMKPSLADFTAISNANETKFGDQKAGFDPIKKGVHAIFHAPPG